MTILQILRSLHPEKDLHTDEEMLDSSLSQWRREAELALHIKEVNLVSFVFNVNCCKYRIFTPL